MSLPWPKFWAHVPEADREPLRHALTKLLFHGVILGDEGGGRELYQMVRDRCRHEVDEYLAPLGLKLIVHPEPHLIIQAEPQAGECGLLATFTQQETLLALVLWRMYDEVLVVPSSGHPTSFTLNEVWTKWQVFLPSIEPPSIGPLEEVLKTLRRKRFVRRIGTADPQHPGDTQIEVLPTLVRAIGFDGIGEWQSFASAYPRPDAT